MKHLRKVINGKSVEIKVYSTNRSRTDDDKDMDNRAKTAVHAAIKRSEVCNTPIAKYDNERRLPYLEYPDGSRVYG